MYHNPNEPGSVSGAYKMANMLCSANEIRATLLESVGRIVNLHGIGVELRQTGPIKRLNLFLLSLLVLPYSSLANAAVDATGSFSGSITHSATTCAVGYSDTAQTESATMTFTQSGASFSGSGSVGHTTFNSISGSISATGSITGASFTMTESSGPGGSGNFSGSLSGNTVTLSGTWTDTGYPTTHCTGTFSGTLTRGGAIVSASSPSSTATAP
ncbi:MAG: hypothetical protein K9J42_14640, partial [Sulfuritalea sp.]|nr:hypothetical protein [Sulfuritalea sp.]